jgi:ATP-dependent Clp protease adapter protein ClpS
MSATKTPRAEEVRTGEETRTEPPWNVILHNSWHPMSWVVCALVRSIPGTTIKKATQIMWTAHTKGQAVAKSCHKELAELYEERLREKGLTVSIEPAH